MLLELHVRNLALIEKADLEFREGLTVLSGETGAGKSILVDSINLALGARTGRSVIRDGADSAVIELLFQVRDPEKLEKIRALDIVPEEDGTLIVSRRIMASRSVARVNDEAVTAARLRQLTGLLIDMHGQFEHQSLMYPSSHLQFIDRLSPEGTDGLRGEIRANVRELGAAQASLADGSDAFLREREADILRYEVEEIEKAQLREGEEEELLQEFRRMKHASRISELLSAAANALDTEAVSYAVRDVGEAASYDPGLGELKEMLAQVDSLLSESRRAAEDYLEGMEYDGQRFEEVESRLDVIHRLQGKYGDDIRKIRELAEEKRQRLEFLDNYDARRERLLRRRDELEQTLTELCGRLTAVRKETAERLKKQICAQLEDLNFTGARFDIGFRDTGRFTENGRDEAQFLISTNPGQDLRPLREVASGGELSRIMLALKTVLADTDETETLIFDEVDAGISGRTAQKVAEKLSLIGRGHQVLCITHLPQIAAMADRHYLISKSTDGSSTRTDIREIAGEDVTAELARLIGGTQITGSVLDAAREIKQLADRSKKERHT